MNKAMIILGLLLIISSVASLDSTSVYAGEKVVKYIPVIEQVEKGVYPSFPDLPGKYVSVEIIDNTDECLIDCEMTLNVSTDILLVPSDVEAQFKNRDGNAINREYTYERLVTQTRDKICKNFTELYEEKDGLEFNHIVWDSYVCGTEEYQVWVEGLPVIEAGGSRLIKLKGKKDALESIDAIPEIYGVSFPEFAWWNSSWGYRCIYEYNTTVSGSLIEIADSNCDFSEFQSDFNDSRFVIEWNNGTNEEIAYDFLNSSASYAWFLINTSTITSNDSSQYDIVLYGGNSGAPYAGNLSGVAKGGLGSTFRGEADYSFPTYMTEDVGSVSAIMSEEMWINATTGSDAEVSFTAQHFTTPSIHVNRMRWVAGGSGADVYGISMPNGGLANPRWKGKNGLGYQWNAGAWQNATYTMVENTYYLTEAYWNGSHAWLELNRTLLLTDYKSDAGVSSKELRLRAENWVDVYVDYMFQAEDGWDEAVYYFSSAENGTTYDNSPELQSIELGPSTIYPSTPVWCEVNWTDDNNATFEVHLGLAINGTITDAYNQTNYTYSNATLWNYTSFDVSAYGNNTNVSCWSWATDGVNASGYNYTANITMNETTFSWNNYTWSDDQNETQLYNYTANFTLPDDYDIIEFVYFHIHSQDITPTCSNESTTWYCEVEVEAPLTTVNATQQTAYWIVNYTNGSTYLESNVSFTPTFYYSIWATNITSAETAIEQLDTTVNVTYGYAASMTGTVSGTAYLGSSSGTFTCAAGDCTATVEAPDVDTPTLYQTEANLTISSAYWAETETRTVRIEVDKSAFPADSGSCYGGSNCANGYDGDWNTYFTMSGISQYINVTYDLGGYYQLDDFEYKVAGPNTYNSTPDEDCIDTSVVFQIKNVLTDDYEIFCANASDGDLISLGTRTLAFAFAYTYETQLFYSQNNSYTLVNPYGLTNCSSGVNLFNYSCRDEDTQVLMNCNYSQTFTVVSAAGTTYETFSGEDDEWDICFYPADLEANISSIEQYDATSYQTRFYYLFGVETGATSYNQTIFMVDDTDGVITFIYVREYGVAVPSVYVYVQKYFVEEGVFKTVAMAYADEDGKGVTYLVPNDEFYRFIVYRGGEIVYTSDSYQVGCTGTYCTVNINIEDSQVETWDYIDGIASNCSWTNATKIIACSFTVLDSTQHTFTLDVYEWDRSTKSINCTNSTTTASGTLWCDLGGASVTGLFTYYLTAESTPFILQEGSLDLNLPVDWGDDGLIFALITVLVCTFIFAMGGPTLMVVGAYIGVVVSYVFQFLELGDGGLGVIAGLGILVGVFVYAFRR